MSGVTPALVLLLGALTAFGPMSIDMYLPSLPALSAAFRAPIGAVQLTLSSYFVGIALGQLFYGPISDASGRKRPLIAGLVLYIVTSLGCVAAPTIGAMIGLRFVQALGGCAGMIIARAVVRDFVSGQEAARVFSTLMLVMGVAPILAPVAGGYVLAWFGWRAIFLVLAAFGAACLVAVLLRLPETLPLDKRHRGGIDTAVHNYAHLLRDRRFVGFALATGFGWGTMFVYITGSPGLFIGELGLSPTAYALLFGSNAAALIGASQLNRLLLRRYSLYAVLAYGLAVHLAGSVVVLIAAASGAGVWLLWAPLFVTLGSLGFIGPNGTAAALAGEARLAGSASSLAGTVPFVSGACGGALMGAVPGANAVKMAALMLAYSAIAFVSHRALVGRAGRD